MPAPHAPSARTLVIALVAVLCAAIGLVQWLQRAAVPHAAADRHAPGEVDAGAPGSAAARQAAAQSFPWRGAERKPSEAGGPLPVQLSFHRRLAHTDRRHRGRPSYVIDARIYNASSEPLAVEVLVSSPGLQGGTMIELSVAPNGIADFGADDGLEMHADDMVTLRSPPFGDFTTQVP